MNSIALKQKSVVRSARPAFLVLPIICVISAVATTLLAGSSINATTVGLILLMGLLAHASVNWFNEYHDFKSGLDFHTKRTPFSGGSGSLPEHPEAASWVLYAAITSLLFVIAIGGYFVRELGLPLLIYGILGALVIVLYTGPINRNPFLCLIAPGFGFGVLMVLGAHHVLAHSLNSAALIGALIVFFLSNNLLLLNQFPDIEADKQAGRFHALIAWGVRPSCYVLLMNWLATVLVMAWAILAGVVPSLAVLAFVGLVPGFIALRGAFKYGEHLGDFPQFMAANVVCTLCTPLLFGVGIMISLYAYGG